MASDGGFVLPDADAAAATREERIVARLSSCRGIETGCHDAANPAGLVLGRSPNEDLRSLISVRSTLRPDLFRVEPGAPERSWLYLEVKGDRDAGVEVAMPLGSSGDPAFAAELHGWIEAGAPNPFSDAGP